MNMPITHKCQNAGCANQILEGTYCMECLIYLEEWMHMLNDPGDSEASHNIEKDPHGRNPKEPGAKLDYGKSPVRRGLLEYFPRACLAVANVSAFGANKYAWKGWETVPEGIDRYGDAEVRHICKAAIEGPTDSDSQLIHAAHEAWNAMARLELILRENQEKEDSPG